MIATVLDPNVLVSGIGWRDSVPGRVVDALVAGSFVAVTSPALLAELERVLGYPKLAAVLEESAALLALVQAVSTVVEPARRIGVLGDEADNRLLEAAVAAQATCIVSGDRQLLELGEFEGTRSVSPRSFLSMLPS